EGGEVAQRRRVQLLAGAQPRFPGRRGELVPGADGKAVVAPEDAVADGRAELVRDRPLVLDREVGDAAARIKAERCGKRPGRADVEAAAAAAAAFGVRGISGQ